MHIRAWHLGLLVLSILASGCAGYRGGWESIAYLDGIPPAATAGAAHDQAGRPAELSVPGLKLEVSIDNQLRTYDTQVYFIALPLSVDPRAVYPKNHQPGRTRVFVTASPQVPGFVFRPAAAALQVAGRRHTGAAGFEFGRWNDDWQRDERHGKWQHRPIASEYVLAEPGRRYYLSIDFATPVPSPESPDIVLDLSQALRSSTEPALPLIRFAPVRWREGYT